MKVKFEKLLKRKERQKKNVQKERNIKLKITWKRKKNLGKKAESK